MVTKKNYDVDTSDELRVGSGMSQKCESKVPPKLKLTPCPSCGERTYYPTQKPPKVYQSAPSSVNPVS